VNKDLLNIEVQNFIKDNLNSDIPSLSLKKSPFPTISSKELAEQVDSKKRCEHKLPLWFQTPGIYYPPKLAIEQASSELAAIYKSNLIIRRRYNRPHRWFWCGYLLFCEESKECNSL
jgi:hypothetical protein